MVLIRWAIIAAALSLSVYFTIGWTYHDSLIVVVLATAGAYVAVRLLVKDRRRAWWRAPR